MCVIDSLKYVDVAAELWCGLRAGRATSDLISSDKQYLSVGSVLLYRTRVKGIWQTESEQKTCSPLVMKCTICPRACSSKKSMNLFGQDAAGRA